MTSPGPKAIAAADAHIERMDRAFREHLSAGVPIPLDANANTSQALEVAQFAFGLMAAIMRSSKAVALLHREGYGVEARPVFRSTLDQILAIFSIQSRGIYAVHAYGKELAYNYRRLLEASRTGFPLGKVNEEYINKFLDLADNLPWTDENKKAENAIKTFQAAKESGSEGAAVYQMWLEATPLSKPSMRLVDAYTGAEMLGDKVIMHALFDSDTDSVVDARLVLAGVIPMALLAFAKILDDPGLEVLANTFGEQAVGIGR